MTRWACPSPGVEIKIDDRRRRSGTARPVSFVEYYKEPEKHIAETKDPRRLGRYRRCRASSRMKSGHLRIIDRVERRGQDGRWQRSSRRNTSRTS